MQRPSTDVTRLARGARRDHPTPSAVAQSSIGEMAERFKAPVLKTGEGSNLPWVRIPLSPPVTSKLLILITNFLGGLIGGRKHAEEKLACASLII